ncbi:MAG: hypothetical protein KGH75_02470 [Rhodospirillales bacterium]|nr:hypothetical protein [Rhodospirillales bacterium]
MSFSLFEIPLTAQAQKFRTTLGGTVYTFTLVWRNDSQGGWVLNIGDAQNNQLVQGIPLVTGVDLLGQYAYLGFPGKLVVQSDGQNLAPTYAGLGTTSKLYFIPH